MAKMDKLIKSFEAFINEDTTQAKQLYREFFIESAQEINRDLQESMEEELEEGILEEENLEEGFDVFEAEDEESEPEMGGDMSDDFEDDVAVEDPEGTGEEEDDAPTAEEWAELSDAFDELEALFDEISGGEEAGEDLGIDDGGDADLDMDEIEFGDDELKEGIEMKAVKDPDMKSEEQGVDTHSPVASQKPSPVGVNATDGIAGDGKVTGSNTKLDTSAPGPQVDDHGNQMNSGKEAVKKEKEPKMNKEEAGVDKDSLIKDMRK